MSTDEIERRHWAIVLAYLEQATPEQWHIYAARSNYDDNMRGLRWLLDNSALDEATARMIYWNLGAGYFVQFATGEDAGSYRQEVFDLLRLIEQRCAGHYYRNRALWFDPAHSMGARPDEYAHIEVKRPIPAPMYEPIGDRYVELEDLDGYDDGLPLAVAQEIFDLYE
jgi:hypothetical protein